MRCAIFGASGGIGSAVIAQLQERREVTRIYAGARLEGKWDDSRVIPFRFELCDETLIVGAAEMMAERGPLDLVIVTTGILQRAHDIRPEKSWRAIDADAMAESFRVNTIGPALIAKHMLPLLSKEGSAKFAVLSARVGSISDNRLGGWHSYRASKAALNMLVRNFAIELRRANPNALAVALHPGTVDTALSKPFRSSIPDRRLFTPDHSAKCLLSVLEDLTPSDSGGFFAWDGSAIEW